MAYPERDFLPGKRPGRRLLLSAGLAAAIEMKPSKRPTKRTNRMFRSCVACVHANAGF